MCNVNLAKHVFFNLKQLQPIIELLCVFKEVLQKNITTDSALEECNQIMESLSSVQLGKIISLEFLEQLTNMCYEKISSSNSVSKI